MTPNEMARMREWCEAQMATTTDPRVLAEIIKLRDVLTAFDAPRRARETDAEIEALAERITGRS
jgi:hypothetical protein